MVIDGRAWWVSTNTGVWRTPIETGVGNHPVDVHAQLDDQAYAVGAAGIHGSVDQVDPPVVSHLLQHGGIVREQSESFRAATGNARQSKRLGAIELDLLRAVLQQVFRNRMIAGPECLFIRRAAVAKTRRIDVSGLAEQRVIFSSRRG
jgi:hypothetical protein